MATQQIKDILDAKIPKPLFNLSPTLKSPVSGLRYERAANDSDPETGATQLNPQTNRWEPIGADKPRVKGAETPLLNEAQTTNTLPYSARLNEWASGTDLTLNAKDSIIAGHNGYQYSSGTDSWLEAQKSPITNPQTYHVLVERQSDDVIQMFAEERPVANDLWGYQFDFAAAENGNDPWNKLTDGTGSGGVQRYQKVRDVGPNGGVLYRLEIVLSPDSAQVGESGVLKIAQNSSDAIWHYVGLYLNRYEYSSPILTKGSEVTRGEDNTYLREAPEQSWSLEDTFTWYMEFELERGDDSPIGGDSKYGNYEYLIEHSYDQIWVHSDGGLTFVGTKPNEFERVKVVASMDENGRRHSRAFLGRGEETSKKTTGRDNSNYFDKDYWIINGRGRMRPWKLYDFRLYPQFLNDTQQKALIR